MNTIRDSTYISQYLYDKFTHHSFVSSHNSYNRWHVQASLHKSFGWTYKQIFRSTSSGISFWI